MNLNERGVFEQMTQTELRNGTEQNRIEYGKVSGSCDTSTILSKK